MRTTPQIPALLWLEQFQNRKRNLIAATPPKDVVLKIEAHVPDTVKFERLLAALDKAKAIWSRDLAKMPYPKFLQTRYWALIRQAKLIECDSRCEVCAANESLQIHHTSYKLRGREHKNLRYLNVLCDACHSKRHGK